MLMVQVQFERIHDSGSRTGKLVWVSADWHLKEGDIVSFEDSPDIRWNVVKVYKSEISVGMLQKKWGLDLPTHRKIVIDP